MVLLERNSYGIPFPRTHAKLQMMSSFFRIAFMKRQSCFLIILLTVALTRDRKCNLYCIKKFFDKSKKLILTFLSHVNPFFSPL